MDEKLILSMKIGEDYEDLLTIPKSELAWFSLRPLKWLTFVGYTISGTKGELSVDRRTRLVEADLEEQPVADRYYYMYEGMEFSSATVLRQFLLL